jgi:hypothetical protein
MHVRHSGPIFVLLHDSKMGILIPYHVITISQLNDQNLMRCYTRSYYRKQNAADMYIQDVLQPKSVFFTYV